MTENNQGQEERKEDMRLDLELGAKTSFSVVFPKRLLWDYFKNWKRENNINKLRKRRERKRTKEEGKKRRTNNVTRVSLLRQKDGGEGSGAQHFAYERTIHITITIRKQYIHKNTK